MEHLLAEFAEMLRSERDIAAHSPVFSFTQRKLWILSQNVFSRTQLGTISDKQSKKVIS